MSIIGRIRALRRPRAATEHQPELPLQAPSYEGYVDELSPHHVAGWLTGPGEAAFEAVLPDGDIVARGAANQFKFGPSHAGQGRHGFFERFTRELSAEELATVVVRDPAGQAVAHSDHVNGEYRPLMLNAMDIVDNCNLRCPFCLYDYSKTFSTNVMDDATIEAALRFLPYTLDSNFWFSCLHEPALHPRFAEYLNRVPQALRRKVFFTTNLAKRMPPEYFMFLANGGFHTVNISIESLDPAIYERMRKGARHRIFMANWDALMAAFSVGTAPPFLRYIVMVYKSNLAEIPALVEHLLAQRRGDEIQLRFTFDVPHIPSEFQATEYIDDAEWDWLAAQVAHHPADKVQVIRPPAVTSATAASPDAADQGAVFLPGRFEFRLSWDGTIEAKRFWAIPYDTSGEAPLAVVNVRDIADPLAFFDELTRISADLAATHAGPLPAQS
jgi:molybdenum cofactor biosynthesis enzyme MoaA